MFLRSAGADDGLLRFSNERPVQTPLSHICNARCNELLIGLPDADWARWQPQLERVSLPVGAVLCRSGNTYLPGKVVPEEASNLHHRAALLATLAALGMSVGQGR